MERKSFLKMSCLAPFAVLAGKFSKVFSECFVDNYVCVAHGLMTNDKLVSKVKAEFRYRKMMNPMEPMPPTSEQVEAFWQDVSHRLRGDDTGRLIPEGWQLMDETAWTQSK